MDDATIGEEPAAVLPSLPLPLLLLPFPLAKDEAGRFAPLLLLLCPCVPGVRGRKDRVC
jgi:hypothetical protein